MVWYPASTAAPHELRQGAEDHSQGTGPDVDRDALEVGELVHRDELVGDGLLELEVGEADTAVSRRSCQPSGSSA